MKHFCSLFFFILISLCALAQAPAQINYQGVARNSLGAVAGDRNIRLRLTIREGSGQGEMLYQETKTVRTNQVGLFTVAIGGAGATTVVGNLQSVNWATDSPKFLQVEAELDASNGFTNMGASQLLSVPYALYAASAAPTGKAGGDLAGSFPQPVIAPNAVTNQKIADGAVSVNKISVSGADSGQVLLFNGHNVIWGNADNRPFGDAGGDLAGSYPNPSLGTGTVSNSKLTDGAVTSSKLANGAVTGIKLQDGSVGSTKLANTAVNTNHLADNSITTVKIRDGAITGAKLAAGLIPASLPPSGAAGGELAGEFPNPTIAAGAVGTGKLADGAVNSNKLADGAVTGAKISTAGAVAGQVLAFDGNSVAWSTPAGGTLNGNAGGDLSGVYPNPSISANSVNTAKLADASVTTPKLADNAVTTAKIEDGAITAEKLAPGLVPGGTVLSGNAGGDLSGHYPNPNIASGAVTNNKIANGAVITPKLADGAVNSNKLADGAVTGAKISTAGAVAGQVLAFDGSSVAWSTPAGGTLNGNAGGDLSGVYPNPVLSRIRGIDISNASPINGQVLKFDGTQWTPAADNTGQAFSLPYSNSSTASNALFSVGNTGAGAAVDGVNTSAGDQVSGITGRIAAANPGAFSAGIKGVNNGTGINGIGVYGTHAGKGWGVYGSSATGTGVFGYAANGFGLIGSSVNGTGLYADSKNGNAAFVEISNPDNTADALLVVNSGQGNAISVSSATSNAIAATSTYAPAISANSDNANGIEGITSGSDAVGVLALNAGSGAGAWGVALGEGVGVKASSFTNGGTALEAELDGVTSGSIATFKRNGSNVARIDHNGRGYFNGGTTNSGADVAETFAVEGRRSAYEPGDVLVISQASDRTVEKSGTPYSTLVAGVYATKPGLLLTEKNPMEESLDDMVPMGVIGVIPTKVCLEGGAIKRGDLLVTSSLPGVAMRADPEKVKVGQVIGKALQDYNTTGTGKINALISIK